MRDWREIDGSISPPTFVWWEDGIFVSHMGAVSPHAAAAIFAENGGVARYWWQAPVAYPSIDADQPDWPYRLPPADIQGTPQSARGSAEAAPVTPLPVRRRSPTGRPLEPFDLRPYLQHQGPVGPPVAAPLRVWPEGYMNDRGEWLAGEDFPEAESVESSNHENEWFAEEAARQRAEGILPQRGPVPRSASPRAPSVRRNRNPGSVVADPAPPAAAAPPARRRVRVPDPDQLVNLAATGRCFHTHACQFVERRAPILLELGRARQRGLRPCAMCGINALIHARTIEVDEDEDPARFNENLRRLAREGDLANVD